MFRGKHATCSCENGKYARSFIDDSVITSNEIMEETKSTSTKTASANFNGKR